MTIKKKIIGIVGLFSLFMINLPLTLAQDAPIFDDIKSVLQESDIALIDFSSPQEEGSWGSLNGEWVVLLSENYADLGELATVFEDFFSSLNEQRSTLSNLIAERSNLINQAEIKEKEIEIAEANKVVKNTEAKIKVGVVDIISEVIPADQRVNFATAESPDEVKNLLQAIFVQQRSIIDAELILATGSDAEKQKAANDIQLLNTELRKLESELEGFPGLNLIFNEIDFYHSYEKWGTIPSRIYMILEAQGNIRSIGAVGSSLDLSSEQSYQDGIDFLRVMLEGHEGLSDDDIQLVIDAALIYAVGGGGEAQINQGVFAVAKAIRNIVGGIAVLWIVIAGVQLVFSQGDEAVITKQKTAILYGVIGLVAILLISSLIQFIYGTPGEIRTSLVEDEGFSREVLGLVSFMKALIGTVAILFIVISGIRMLFAQGEEDQIKKQKQSLLWVGSGLILIAINEVIVENFFIAPTQSQGDQLQLSNIESIVNTFGQVMQFLLGFVGIIMLAILVYGAGTMIMNYGNDEMVEKSKKIIRNSIIGIIVILSAYVIVVSLLIVET